MFGPSVIRRIINELPENKLFNNRQFLAYALRRQIDFVLHKLCRQGRIIRVAQGVYRKTPRDMAKAWNPTIEEIVSFKARIFARRTITDFRDAAAQLLPGISGHPEMTHAVDGATSCFTTKTGDKRRIHFVQRSARKIELNDHPLLMNIKAVWYGGKKAVERNLYIVMSRLNGVDKEIFRELAPLMPAWMSDALKGSLANTRELRRIEEASRKEQALKANRPYIRRFSPGPNEPEEYFDVWEYCRNQHLIDPPNPDFIE